MRYRNGFFAFLLIATAAWPACGERKTPTMELKTQAPAKPSEGAAAPASAPAPSQPAAAPAKDGKKLSQAELEKILSPIALYPDPLLAQILPASTYPMEVIEAARLIKSDADLNLIDGQSWDPSVKAVAHYPSVLQLMNANLTWMQQLGNAVINQQQDVLAAIQTLRAQAQKQGNLKTNKQQVVQTTQEKIEILPPTPDVIYVPTYDPAVVYTTPAPAAAVAAPLISFGAGVAMGAWLGGGFYWPSNTIVWHSGYWGNTYWNNGYWNHGWNNVNVNVNNVNVNNWNHNDYNWNNSTWNHNTAYDNNWNHNTADYNNYNHDNYNDNRSMFSQNNSNLSASQVQKQNTQNFENAMKDQPNRDTDTGAGDKQNNLGGEDRNADRSNFGNADRSNYGSADRSNYGGGDRDSWGGSHDGGGLFGGGGDGDRTMDDSMRGFQSRGGGGGFGGFSNFGGGRDFGGGGGFHGGGGFRRR